MSGFFEGEVISIHLAEAVSGPVVEVQDVEAVPDAGLRGDRNFERVHKGKREPHRAVTLIEEEALLAAAEKGLDLPPGGSRRNLMTRGVPLNHLVGRRFRVGEVLLEGTELCEPCKHLEKLTGQKVIGALVHRGGLCARIVEGGVIRQGDRVVPE